MKEAMEHIVGLLEKDPDGAIRWSSVDGGIVVAGFKIKDGEYRFMVAKANKDGAVNLWEVKE